MSDHDELGRTLRTLLLQEADAMDIDTREATERLTRELGPTSSTAQAGAGGPGGLRRRPGGTAGLVEPWRRTPGHRTGRRPVPVAGRCRRRGVLPRPHRRRTDRCPAGDAAAIVDTSDDVAFSPAGDRVVYGTCLIGTRALLLRRPALPCQRRRHGPAHPEPPVRPQRLLPRLVPGRYDAGLPGASGRCRRRRQPLPPRPRHRRADPADRSRPGACRCSGRWTQTSAPTASASSTRSRAPRSWTRAWDVWEVPVAGGEPTRLFENADAPQYLADGRIAFIRDGSGDDTPDTLLAAAPGGEPEVLVEYEAEDGTAASPDGTRIAYVDDGVLHLLDLASGRVRDAGGRRSVRLGRRRPAPGRPRPRAAVVPGPDYCGSLRPLARHPAWDVCFCLPT